MIGMTSSVLSPNPYLIKQRTSKLFLGYLSLIVIAVISAARQSGPPFHRSPQRNEMNDIDIVAFVVGIERYAQGRWDRSGPCRNAIDISRYLLSIDVAPKKIFM